MFPTPPSLEQPPAFSPITTYRDTPSQEPPVPGGAADHLLPLTSAHLPEYKMETEEGVASPPLEDNKVRRGGWRGGGADILQRCPIKTFTVALDELIGCR